MTLLKCPSAHSSVPAHQPVPGPNQHAHNTTQKACRRPNILMRTPRPQMPKASAKSSREKAQPPRARVSRDAEGANDASIAYFVTLERRQKTEKTERWLPQRTAQRTTRRSGRHRRSCAFISTPRPLSHTLTRTPQRQCNNAIGKVRVQVVVRSLGLGGGVFVLFL
jgi:hypothetical protein